MLRSERVLSIVTDWRKRRKFTLTRVGGICYEGCVRGVAGSIRPCRGLCVGTRGYNWSLLVQLRQSRLSLDRISGVERESVGGACRVLSGERELLITGHLRCLAQLWQSGLSHELHVCGQGQLPSLLPLQLGLPLCFLCLPLFLFNGSLDFVLDDLCQPSIDLASAVYAQPSITGGDVVPEEAEVQHNRDDEGEG